MFPLTNHFDITGVPGARGLRCPYRTEDSRLIHGLNVLVYLFADASAGAGVFLISSMHVKKGRTPAIASPGMVVVCISKLVILLWSY